MTPNAPADPPPQPRGITGLFARIVAVMVALFGAIVAGLLRALVDGFARALGGERPGEGPRDPRAPEEAARGDDQR